MPSTSQPAPERTRQLSEGLVIETLVLARLFGIKLLTLEGTVLVSPAQEQGLGLAPVVSPSAAAQPPATHDALETALKTGDTPASVSHAGKAIGSRLGLSERLLRESADELRGLDHDQ